ncbi:hypothetical protein QBC36DRAFT_184283 [Triangularia setosa]|uniref:Cell wall mannoprotein PIR1-like C-terminal domain-containing protein n=1 Tax=Triangularia setosa TaxID=2587417 RepID=A0AAN6W987_9PEZI|nr:hypothetical protein QBC36DRAFT_184283 [Podospora setosa]
MFVHILTSLVLGLSRLVTADANTCLFHLCSVDASSNNLTVGQLPGGQLQGSKAKESATWFRLYNGRLLDQALRGCWWASGSTVLVCDVPFSDAEEPDKLFSVTMHGDNQSLTYNQTLSFYSCRSGRYDKVNYYLKQQDATCQQIFLHVDPDMACFPESSFTTSTTPTLTFSTPIIPIPGETITTKLLSTVYDATTEYSTTSETLPAPSSPPFTYTHPPHSHSLSTIEALTPIPPPLPSFSTLLPLINTTSYPLLTAPAASDLSTIPLKSFTGVFSWTNSTTLPATLKTKTFSPGVSGSFRRTQTTTYITEGINTFTKSVSSSKPAPVATTLLFHTEREKGSTGGPVLATFTVTGEEGAVVTFAVEVEG